MLEILKKCQNYVKITPARPHRSRILLAASVEKGECYEEIFEDAPHDFDKVSQWQLFVWLYNSEACSGHRAQVQDVRPPVHQSLYLLSSELLDRLKRRTI